MTKKRRYRKVLGVKFNIRCRTTTKRGRRIYMRLYMRLYRRRLKRRKRGKK